MTFEETTCVCVCLCMGKSQVRRPIVCMFVCVCASGDLIACARADEFEFSGAKWGRASRGLVWFGLRQSVGRWAEQEEEE